MSKIVPLDIDSGATYKIVITVKDTDITGYVARCQFRRKIEESVSFEATNSNGKIVFTDASIGKMTMTITDSETELLSGSYVYDFEIETPGGEVTRILQGVARISPQVTR